MPNNKQAAKRVRQDNVRRERNRARKSMIRTQGRRVLSALESGNVAEAETHFVAFQERVDKAAKHRTIHPNAAARKKSRMAGKIQAAKKS